MTMVLMMTMMTGKRGGRKMSEVKLDKIIEGLQDSVKHLEHRRRELVKDVRCYAEKLISTEEKLREVDKQVEELEKGIEKLSS